MKDGSLAELDLVGTLWRHKVWLIACVVLAGTLGYGLSMLLPERYTAESRVFLSTASPFDPLSQRSTVNQQRYVVQQAALMSSQAVLDRVVLPPGVSRERLGFAIEITPSADSDLVVVSATAADPAAAAALADGVANAFQEFTAARVAEEAERAIAAVTDPAQADQVRAAAAVYGDGVAVVDRAQVPTSPSAPAPLRNAVLLAVLAGLVYALVALLPDRHKRGDLIEDAEPDPADGDAPAVADSPSPQSAVVAGAGSGPGAGGARHGV